jgi:UDP-glucose 4-epimerase
MVSTLVTGGAGFIGSHVAHELVDRGERVVVVDNLSTGLRAAVPAGAAWIEGDIGDEALMLETMRQFEVDTVFHFAASMVAPESYASPAAYYLNNTVKTRALVSAAVQAGVPRFVFSSTAAVYGDAPGGVVDEAHPTRPTSPYGASKLMGEQILGDAAAAHGFSYAVLRYFNVAGADPASRTGQPPRSAQHLVKICAQAALGKRDGVDIFGADYPTPDGTCVRDYVHVSDLANVHVRAMDGLRAGERRLLLNCGYGEGHSVREVIDAAKRVSGVDFQVREAPRRRGDAPAIIARADLVRERLGWRPRHQALGEIIAHTLAWERRIA